ncbi:MAG: tetraacyldisaccharide 4'-kinase [Hyphomicrobiaceae bacterium]
MPADEPSWWYGTDRTAAARLLRPAARVWGWAAQRRVENAKPRRSSLPVICIGNFTAGGTGKTPLAIYVARALLAAGEHPAFLSRGYRGRHAGPRRVDPVLDSARDVGDEPLLLTAVAPTIISRDRAQGAALIEAEAGLAPPTVIVMDDGLQNPSLHKDLSIAVVDGRRGVGNGEVIPAGPLRAPLAFQLGLADVLLVNRPRSEAAGTNGIGALLRQRFQGPVLEAWVEPAGEPQQFSGQRVLAFSGIANPERFFSLLRELGADVVDTVTYPDHHLFTAAEARHALARARELDARLVTTEKDLVRLPAGNGALADLRKAAHVLPVVLTMERRDSLRLLR